MNKAVLIEEEFVFLGLDERAAVAIADENDGLRNKTTVIDRAVEAQCQVAGAA